MKSITILPETTKNPITLIGHRAGVCWGADVTDDKKNYKRGLDCIKANHGRALEYVNIETIINGKRVLIPFHEHFIKNIDFVNRVIEFSEVEGLL